MRLKEIFWAAVKKKRDECLLVPKQYFTVHLKKNKTQKKNPPLLIKYLKVSWVASCDESHLCKSSTSKWRNYNKNRSQRFKKLNCKANRCFLRYCYRCIFWQCISLLIISMQFIEIERASPLLSSTGLRSIWKMFSSLILYQSTASGSTAFMQFWFCQ